MLGSSEGAALGGCFDLGNVGPGLARASRAGGAASLGAARCRDALLLPDPRRAFATGLRRGRRERHRGLFQQVVVDANHPSAFEVADRFGKNHELRAWLLVKSHRAEIFLRSNIFLVNRQHAMLLACTLKGPVPARITPQLMRLRLARLRHEFCKSHRLHQRLPALALRARRAAVRGVTPVLRSAEASVSAATPARTDRRVSRFASPRLPTRTRADPPSAFSTPPRLLPT